MDGKIVIKCHDCGNAKGIKLEKNNNLEELK